MAALIFHSQSLLHFSTSSPLSKTKLGRPNFPRKEIADGSLQFASQKVLLHPLILSIQANGDTRGLSSQRISALRRTPKDDGSNAQRSPGGKSSKKQEFISILRQIRSSISRKSESAKETSPESYDEKDPVESVLEVLRQSRGQGKTARKEGKRALTPRRHSSRKELNAVSSPPLTRPRSSFTRRSPVPSHSNRQETVKLRSLPLTAMPGENKIELQEREEEALLEVEKMKLHELKELAKSKGIRGYSKLKKAELIKLLSTS